MMKVIFSTIALLISSSSFAQIASASLFKEMMSQNPAVISQRPAATLSMALRRDSVDKEQDVTNSALYTESKSEIDITNYSFFYGGKGGKGITTEVSGEISSGEKKDTVTTSGASETPVTNADMMMLNASMGLFNHFGLGVMRVTEDRTQTSVTGNGNYDTTVTSLNFGARFNLGVDIGVFYQSTTFESIGSFAGSAVNMDIDMPRVGLGIGGRGKNFHFELGYVMDLEEIREDQGGGSGAGTNVTTYNPAKVFSALEFRLGGLMLGVSSNYYMDGFFDFKNLMYYTMVLSSNKENRLENTFNFSLGGDKGSSFSGSVTYSTVESEELPPTLAAGVKLKTTSTILGAQLSYTYNF
ncbi:MAG: hypothetical protein K9K67_11510 [Bacteriovoracaceae bacterium]|nr:hypothetical protein [Bacteriovoracaceae bacterium]